MKTKSLFIIVISILIMLIGGTAVFAAEPTFIMEDIRTVNVTLDDIEAAPELTRLSVINVNSGTYSAGTVIQISATFSKILTTDIPAPILEIGFGTGESIFLENGVINENEIIYTYTISIKDFGKLESRSFKGTVCDLYGNETVLVEAELVDVEVFAKTGVLLTQNGEETLFATLADAVNAATTTGLANIRMLVDEELDEAVIINANKNITLDLDGKVISMAKDESSSLITNLGTLTIVDNAQIKGKLSLTSTNGTMYIINNEGTLTIQDVEISGTAKKTSVMHGIYNAITGKVVFENGNLSVTTENAEAYGIFNGGIVTIKDGTINTCIDSTKGYGVYNNAGSTTMLGGNIRSTATSRTNMTTYGVYCESGFIILGELDNKISKESPSISSATEGINATGGMLEFYDGIVEASAYRSVYTNNVRTVDGYSIIKEIIGSREVATIGIDDVPPVIKLTKSTNAWVKDTVEIYVEVSDVGSGVKSVTYSGEELNLNDFRATIAVDKNGTYTFIATDYAGNTTTEKIEVTNIDKIAPQIVKVTTDPAITLGETTIEFQAKDLESGLNGYALVEENREPTTFEKIDPTTELITIKVEVNRNGRYMLYVRDVAGNITRNNTVIIINTIDIAEPTIEAFRILEEGDGYSDSSTVMLEIQASDDMGVKEILVSDKLLSQNELDSSKNWVNYSERILWSLPIGDKKATVYAWVKDSAGRISSYASANTRILAKYIGNDGTNETTFKVLFKDANYNFDSTLSAADIKIRVKSANTQTVNYESNYGQNITINTITTYGPIVEGTSEMSGRYYLITAKNIGGNGIVYLVFNTNAEKDKAGNKLSNTAEYELITDVTVEQNKPNISVTTTNVTVTDADGHAMNYIKINGQTIPLRNGTITRTTLEADYGITLKSGTVIETIDKCGNTAKTTV